MLRWLEVSADFRCNNRCLGCFSADDAGPSMSAREFVEAIARGYRAGARSLWLGGGEPTLRRDLFAVVSEARRMGYERIKLETNGMMLAYPAYVQRCIEAGVTEVCFSIKGASAETHDRLTRTPGCHALMLRGMDNVRVRGLAMEADVLVYRSNAHELPAIVAEYTPRGISRYRVWILSAADARDPEVRAEVPRIADVVPHLLAAMDLGLSDADDFITSLHTPPCTVPSTHRRCLFHAPDLGLMVANPGGHAFMLEHSPIEGGVYFARCEGCADRACCGGVRRDYVEIHGDSEFAPRDF